MMNRPASPSTAAVLTLLACISTCANAQQPPSSRALTIYPPTGLPIVPVMEGWYENDDGSVTISFGYHNKNAEGTVMIPLGERNWIEPAQFDGVQPTYFDRGRHTGIFTVTLPESMRDESVWWHVRTGENREFKVPGRAASEAYQLDRRPRPQGSLPPEVWFDEDGQRSSGPGGIVTELGGPIPVGSPVTLTVHVRDPSQRDPNDPRFQEPIPVRVKWAVHQGPAAVEFATHETTVIPDQDEPPRPRGRPPEEMGPQDVTLAQGAGTASVYATFTEPGEYMLRLQVDNWAAPESSEADQCCWTNVYQRATVVSAPE
jgi:hypothetical protein